MRSILNGRPGLENRVFQRCRSGSGSPAFNLEPALVAFPPSRHHGFVATLLGSFLGGGTEVHI